MPKRISKKTALLTSLIIGTSSAALAQSSSPVPYIPPPSVPGYAIPPEMEEQRQHSNLRGGLGEAEDRHQIKSTPMEKELAPPSALEKVYAKRIGAETKQFGYDLFGEIENEGLRHTPENITPMGAVQDDFVLGTGDELLVTFTGQRTDQALYKIDTRGMLIIRALKPIPAAGKTILQIRNAVNAQIRATHDTEAFISVSSVKQIGVLVVGHVNNPGRQNLNAFHSILDAINLAGGIKKNGSLRDIKLVRAGKTTRIDLYDILIADAPDIDIRLKDGDRLIIPPIGPTVAVTGAVKRPAIFEIKRRYSGAKTFTHNTSETLTLNQMLALAGGVLTKGDNRFMKASITASGREDIKQITDPFSPYFDDGSILSVLRAEEKKKGTIELIGQTTAAGAYDLNRIKSLSDLISSTDILGENIYAPIGIIERWNTEQLATTYIKFSIRSVLDKKTQINLTENDKIILLSNADIDYLRKEKNSDTENIEKTNFFDKKEGAYIESNDTLKSFLNDQNLTLRGAVRNPSTYPVADNITLDHLIAVAGGLTSNADLSQIEITTKNIPARTLDTSVNLNNALPQRRVIDLQITDAKTVFLKSGDQIRIKQKFEKIKDNTILITGEVRHPGVYDLLPGEKVSDIIRRAGGLNENAYPPGAIFSRAAARRTEEMQFRAAAGDMRQRLAAAIQRDKNAPDATQIALVQSLAAQLEEIKAIGRITVETDPIVLAARPELDMLLEKGDRIYIPKRSLTVRVTGEVLSPAGLQFTKDKSPNDYIKEAGGLTYFADKKRAFLLHPDGSAEPLSMSAWNHTPVFVPPGSAIVIPRDPKPFDFMETAKDIGQILTSVAVTTVFIDEIQDD